MFKVRSAADKVKTEIGAYGFGARAYRGRDRGLWKMERGHGAVKSTYNLCIGVNANPVGVYQEGSIGM